MSSSRSSVAWRSAATRLLVVAAVFALLAAYAELAVLGFRKFLLGQVLFADPRVIWMSPLSHLLLFVVPGVGLLLLRLLWGGPFFHRAVVFLYATLAGFSVLFLFHPSLHKVAIVVLAVGIGTQAARLFVARPTIWYERARRATVVLAAGAVVAGIGFEGYRVVRERAAVSRLPVASAAAPNVLLIVLDTVRAMSMSLYGYARATTPVLERLAARGVVFDRAFSTSPWTLPSHATMFTGRFPHEVSAGWTEPLDDTYPTLAETLAGRGYVTGGFVANTRYGIAELGLDRGFTRYEDYPLSLGEVVLGSSLGRFLANNPTLRRLSGYHEVLDRKPASAINRALLEWLARRDGRPYFAFVNYFDAHEPYLPPAPFDTMFGPSGRRGPYHHQTHHAWRIDKWSMSAEEREVERAAYDGAIAYVDQQIGVLLDSLDVRGDLANTLVVITSDHGEQLGEKGLYGHINSLYLPLVHVPLLLSFPSEVPANVRVTDPVSLRDLPRTVTDLVGGPAGFPGRSLARHWAAGTTLVPGTALSELSAGYVEEDWYPVARGNLEAVVSGDFQYIRSADGTEELYDVVRDPGQGANLVTDQAVSAIVVQLRETLDSIRGRHAPPAASEQPSPRRVAESS